MMLNPHALSTSIQDTHNALAESIGLASAYLDSLVVQRAFDNQLQSLQTQFPDAFTDPMGQELLRQAEQVQRARVIHKNLSECANQQNLSMHDIDRLVHSLMLVNSPSLSCMDIESFYQSAQTSNTSQNLLQMEGQILQIAKSNLTSTRTFWQEQQNNDSLEMAIELSVRSLDPTPPTSGLELMLLTEALKYPTQSHLVRKEHMEQAFQEIETEIDKELSLLEERKTQSPRAYQENLKYLIQHHPVAVATVLLQTPEESAQLCGLLAELDQERQNQRETDELVQWGGLIIGGLLIATGIGSWAGAGLITGTAAASLSTATMGVAAASIAYTGGEVIYTANRSQQSFMEAYHLRRSQITGASLLDESEAVDAVTREAREHMVASLLSSTGLIPFGLGVRGLQATSRGTIRGGASQLDTYRGATQTYEAVKANPNWTQGLIHLRNQSSAEDVAELLGHLAQVPQALRHQVLNSISGNISEASRRLPRALENGRMCRL